MLAEDSRASAAFSDFEILPDYGGVSDDGGNSWLTGADVRTVAVT